VRGVLLSAMNLKLEVGLGHEPRSLSVTTPFFKVGHCYSQQLAVIDEARDNFNDDSTKREEKNWSSLMRK
jgi:hypothetical protein